MATESIINYWALIISIFALFTSISTFIITYLRGRKSEQVKIGMEISNKLHDVEKEILRIEKLTKTNPNDNSVELDLKKARLQYLNIWEYFAFLVNNGEIQNKKVIEYLRPNLISVTKNIFNIYPDISQNEKFFIEIRKLLKKWIQVLNINYLRLLILIKIRY